MLRRQLGCPLAKHHAMAPRRVVVKPPERTEHAREVPIRISRQETGLMKCKARASGLTSKRVELDSNTGEWAIVSAHINIWRAWFGHVLSLEEGHGSTRVFPERANSGLRGFTVFACNRKSQRRRWHPCAAHLITSAGNCSRGFDRVLPDQTRSNPSRQVCQHRSGQARVPAPRQPPRRWSGLCRIPRLAPLRIGALRETVCSHGVS